MSSYVVARTAAVLGTATMVRRMVPATAGTSVAAVTPGKGHDQARAVAIANASLPLRIWSDSGIKDRPREQD